MSKRGKKCEPWCGKRRLLRCGAMGRTWCRKKCRDRFERDNTPRPAASVMQAFEAAYGPLGDAGDPN